MNENKRRGGRVSAQRSHGGTRTRRRGGIHPRNVSGFVQRTLNIHVDPEAAARPEPRDGGATVTGGERRYAPICNHP